MSNLNDFVNNVQKSEHNSGGSTWFKFKEGQNQIRILTAPEMLFENFSKGTCYTGCGFEGTAKGLSWVINRDSNKIELMKIPFTIIKTLTGFQQDEDYSFESFPMPYDLKITAKNAGTKEVEYTVLPSMKQIPVDEETLEKLSKEKTCAEIVQKLKDKQIEKDKASGLYKTPEEREQERLENLKEKIENRKNQRAELGEVDESEIKYPEDDINPDDVPF